MEMSDEAAPSQANARDEAKQALTQSWTDKQCSQAVKETTKIKEMEGREETSRSSR